MIDRWIGWLFACINIGLEFIATHLFTVEGLIAIVFGFFLLGFISHIRS